MFDQGSIHPYWISGTINQGYCQTKPQSCLRFEARKVRQPLLPTLNLPIGHLCHIPLLWKREVTGTWFRWFDQIQYMHSRDLGAFLLKRDRREPWHAGGASRLPLFATKYLSSCIVCTCRGDEIWPECLWSMVQETLLNWTSDTASINKTSVLPTAFDPLHSNVSIINLVASMFEIVATCIPAVITSLIFTTIAFVVVCLRLYTRIFLIKNAGAGKPLHNIGRLNICWRSATFRWLPHGSSDGITIGYFQGYTAHAR